MLEKTKIKFKTRKREDILKLEKKNQKNNKIHQTNVVLGEK